MALTGLDSRQFSAGTTVGPMRTLLIDSPLTGTYFIWQECGWDGTASTSAKEMRVAPRKSFFAPESGRQARGAGITTPIIPNDNDCAPAIALS